MTAARQLAAFLAKFDPAVAAQARRALAVMRRRCPGAHELVYDNYNALAIGFGPSERASDAVFSIAVFPRWVSLFFFEGASLPDPDKRLRGSGKAVRHVVLVDATVIEEPAVRALIAAALARADPPIDPRARRRLVIKSVSARQRPRRSAPGVRTGRRG
jgi:hypothetical protein